MSFLTTLAALIRPLISDQAAAWGAREYFNQRFKSLGMMTTLQIDATNQKGSLDLELKGETQPLHVAVNRYELTIADGKTFLEIKDLQTSREWLNVVGAELVKAGKLKFEIPEFATLLFKAAK